MLAVYFGSVGVKFTRHAVACALIADAAGMKDKAETAYSGTLDNVGAGGAALFQWGFGWLIDSYGYHPVFAIVSVMCIVQAALISILIPRIVPLGERPA